MRRPRASPRPDATCPGRPRKVRWLGRALTPPLPWFLPRTYGPMDLRRVRVHTSRGGPERWHSARITVGAESRACVFEVAVQAAAKPVLDLGRLPVFASHAAHVPPPAGLAGCQSETPAQVSRKWFLASPLPPVSVGSPGRPRRTQWLCQDTQPIRQTQVQLCSPARWDPGGEDGEPSRAVGES